MTYGVHKYTSYKETPFMKDENLIYKEYNHCIAIWDKYPVCEGFEIKPAANGFWGLENTHLV